MNTTPLEIDSPVTTIIVQRPLKACTHLYEEWLKEITPLAQQATGHRGVNIIRPHGEHDAYTVVLHFDSEANLRQWLNSETRKKLVDKVRPYLNDAERIDIRTGLEFWFTPPASKKAAPPYKQYLITLTAIFPLSILVPKILSPLFDLLPVLFVPVVRSFVVSATIVALMTFVIMPRFVRLVARWLYR
ncbi:antibiotic biosynthesis monooxygenase [Arsenicibacter rosenii]|uniref:Antibiotic biosynthesis monooxygenase n=1 Tax=Arsenicibacter rosenii TaxID=1750698 RepID=A0A1S2VCI1_9BACT|nr:antibiotic biosynthesis monooxygenase [Arsenicibacter rosenii]OIN55936.1 antibiotic biosynthesis monooxygenase [Arsenicibacter rosenii]